MVDIIYQNSCDENISNSLLKKYSIKLLQRIGLVLLKPRVLSWIYKKKNQNLLNISKIKEEKEEEDNFEVPKGIEKIIDILLKSIKSQNTIVRWSAAKGIGRITSRLPSSLGDQIVEQIIKQFNNFEGEGAWTGGCLALAELARKNLLLPKRLEKVIPCVIKALQYDVIVGNHSIGANVRDSACYVFWAFARVYEPSIMKDYSKAIATELLIMACFDREINCRRAASAAFQEMVGRLGNFPNGIDIINKADYFSVGNRMTAFLEVSAFIAKFEEYSNHLIDHLITKKLFHWDQSIRELSSKSLFNITKSNPKYMMEKLKSLLATTTSTELNLRHGSILGVSEIILSLYYSKFDFSELNEKITEIVPLLESKRLYRGKGGELIRMAVTRLIQCISECKVPIPEFFLVESFGRKVKKKLLPIYQDTIDENLKHPNEDISRSSSISLKLFSRSYYASYKELDGMKYLKILEKETNPAVRRGFLLALGVLPKHLIDNFDDAIKLIIKFTKIEKDENLRDAETRRNAINSLISICETFGKESIVSLNVNTIFETFLYGTEDYSCDSRGDVGSFVREASYNALYRFTNLVKDDLLTIEMLNTFVSCLMKQSLEPLDKLREYSSDILIKLISSDNLKISRQKELMELFKGFELNDTKLCLSKLINCLQFDEYSLSITEGIILSFSNTSHIRDISKEIIIQEIPKYLQVFQNNILKIFRESLINERITFPIVNLLTFLFENQIYKDQEKYLDLLIELLINEFDNTDNIHKIIASIPLFSMISTLNSGIYHLIWKNLTCSFPKVRQLQSECLIQYFNNEEAINILKETPWKSQEILAKKSVEKLKSLIKK